MCSYGRWDDFCDVNSGSKFENEDAVMLNENKTTKSRKFRLRACSYGGGLARLAGLAHLGGMNSSCVHMGGGMTFVTSILVRSLKMKTF